MDLPQLAMPLFSDPEPVSRAAVFAAWKTLFADGPSLEIGEGKDGVDEYKIEGRSVLVAHIAVPVPNDEALHAIRSSWMWQGSEEPVRTHRAHAIVSAIGENEGALDAAWDVACVCVALLEAGSGAGLYWGNARQTHAVDVATDLATNAATAPVPLWVGITISAESMKGPFSAATHGLEAFGHKEFEVRDTKMAIGELRMTLLDISSYVLDNGPVLLHGQTFGPSANVRWTITHEQSQLVDGRDVIVLGIP